MGVASYAGMAEVRARVLYITYDGLLEPLGRSQIVPYVRVLADAGAQMSILSFEKPDDLGSDRETELRAELERKGIHWTALRYHRSPRVAATLLDLASGVAIAVRAARRRGADIIHARSYVAGLMGWTVKLATGASFVFDIRGFWPEERLELGLFRPNGILYRTSKRVETLLLEGSEHVVVLTESSKAILREREASARLAARRAREKQITVIPCGTDLERFRPAPPDRELARRYGLEGSIVIGNIGAVNKRYMLPEMMRFAFHVQSHLPPVKFVYLTKQDPSPIRTAAREAGLPDSALIIESADPADIPRWLTLFRLGVFFLRPSYAAKASSFTKLPEFLACGVPVVTNTGVGDVDKLLGSSPASVLLPGMTEVELASGARQALSFLDGEAVPDESRERCRAIASSHFALDDGAERYLKIYASLENVPAEVA